MPLVIGKVLDKANTDFFHFVSSEYFDANYVAVNVDHVHEGAKIIGEIIEKESLNPYFENPTDIRYIDSVDEQVANRSLFLAKVRTISMVTGNIRKDVSFPPKPGTNVVKAEDVDIKIALGLANDGLDIGTLSDYNRLSFKISSDQLLRTHIAILGQTGSGKSYFAAKLAIEMIKYRKQVDIRSKVAIPVVFDSSGEYSSLENSDQNKLGLILPVINSKEHYFPLLNQRYFPLLSEIYEFDEREESDLKPWLGYSSDYQVKENIQSSFPEFKDDKTKEVIDQFNQVRISSTAQFANILEELLKKLKTFPGNEGITIPYKAISKMRKLNLKIRKSIEPDIIEKLASGLIINLSDYDNYDERQIALLIFLRQLYEIAKSKKSEAVKIILFIDEAHNYVPSVYKSFCKGEILRLAREGRKYGITLCLISQRPRWVDPTALSQCGNVFIFRIQNSDDKKHIFDSVTLPDSVKALNIARLKTGEMIVSGDVADNAISCNVAKIDKEFIYSQHDEMGEKHFKEIKKKLGNSGDN